MRMTTAIYEGDRLGNGGFSPLAPDHRLHASLFAGCGAVLLSLSHYGASLTFLSRKYRRRPLYHQVVPSTSPARLSGLSTLHSPSADLSFWIFLANFFPGDILEWTGQHVMHRMRQDLSVASDGP